MFVVKKGMRWLHVCYILLALISNRVFSQELSRSLIFNNSGSDSAITYLLDQAVQLREENRDSAFLLVGKALRLSRLSRNQIAVARSLMTLGVIEFDKKDFERSKTYFHVAIKHYGYAPLAKDDLLTKLYTNLAVVYSCLGNNDSATYYQYLCMTRIQGGKTEDSVAMLMFAYNNLGIILFNAEQYEEAIHYISKSLTLSRRLNDSGMLEKNYRNIGTYFIQRGQKPDERDSLQFVLDNMDSARKYFNLTLNINKAEGRKDKIQVTYYQIAIAWLVQRNLEQAKVYLDSAYLAYPQNFYESPELQKGYGDYYYLLSRYEASIPYYERSRAISFRQGTNNSQWNLELYKVLADCYSKTGNGRLAYERQRKYTDLREELYNDEKVKIINNLELRYRTLEKDKELASQKALLLQKENNIRSKNFWIVGIAGCGIFLTLFLVYFFHSRQRLNAEKLARIKRQHELNHLHAVVEAEEEERSRIARDLHDSLGVLLSAAMMNHTILGRERNMPLTDSKPYTEGFALLREMRNTIRGIAHNLMPGTITQQSLAESVQSLCARLQQHNPVVIAFEVYGTPRLLQPERNLSVYRMIEETIQNVIKHAQASKVIIQLLFHEYQLNIVVQDNGVGFDTEISYEGIGLQNLRNRTAKLNGEIAIVSTKGSGTIVELEIPYNNKKAL